MVLKINNADNELLEVINVLSKFRQTPYEVVNEEYNEDFTLSVLQAKEECDKAIANGSVKLISTPEELKKELYGL